MKQHYDLLGIGIGPFHLSLAALLKKVPNLNTLFLDQKPEFLWHPELMFSDANMQTSYMKDLVTPVDPTSPYSFLNYLVQKGLFYSFMNTSRKVITRREFELYCQWTSKQMDDRLRFNSEIKSVDFDKDHFIIKTDKEQFTSTNLSIATGLSAYVPECTTDFIGPEVFHAKSPALQAMSLHNKRVLIVGGGQTGVEIFRNSIDGKWGKVKNIRLISRRQNLQPLDETPFTNEYFTPNYVDDFFSLKQEMKTPIVEAQKLASDGNTPQYLEQLYNDLYQRQCVHQDDLDFKILPFRSLNGLEKIDSGYKARIRNNFIGEDEILEADIIILSTGFKITTPKILEPIEHLINFDQEGRFSIGRNFDLKWKGPQENKIYALNFSRNFHGIAEPQTSLMAWRSATIVNDITKKEFYRIHHDTPCFVQYGKFES